MIVFGVTATRNQLCPSRSIREAPSSRFSMTAPLWMPTSKMLISVALTSGRGSLRMQSFDVSTSHLPTFEWPGFPMPTSGKAKLRNADLRRPSFGNAT